MILTGMLLMLVAEIFKPPEVEDNHVWLNLVRSITITIIIWEGNLRIDHWLNLNYPWIKNTRKRFFIQLLLSPLFTAITLFSLRLFSHQIIAQDHHNPPHRFDPLFMPALFVAFLFLTIDIGYQFFKAWKQSLVEVEKYRRASAEAQLENLKNQINPHFLFNNLSVLSSLVYQNQDKAVDFIKELSNVYRYVLDNKKSELVSIKEELDFLSHYIYLIKIRFEAAVNFSICLDDDLYKNKLLPPLCLQLLVENAIQHNEASIDYPLQISIYTLNDALIIENNMQPRIEMINSTKTGLENIQMRFSYYTDKKVEISNNASTFRVALPLM